MGSVASMVLVGRHFASEDFATEADVQLVVVPTKLVYVGVYLVFSSCKSIRQACGWERPRSEMACYL